MNRPTAIYRPIERDVLLTNGQRWVSIVPERAARIARELAAHASVKTGNQLDLHLWGFGGRFDVSPGDYLHLARDIDHALAVPTIAAAMLDEASCQ